MVYTVPKLDRYNIFTSVYPFKYLRDSGQVKAQCLCIDPKAIRSDEKMFLSIP